MQTVTKNGYETKQLEGGSYQVLVGGKAIGVCTLAQRQWVICLNGHGCRTAHAANNFEDAVKALISDHADRQSTALPSFVDRWYFGGRLV